MSKLSSFSTAPTPPLCDSPTDFDSSYEHYVIRLSVNKLENKKHSTKLRNATLIRSVHQRALQVALSASLTWDNDQQSQDFTTANFDTDSDSDADTTQFSFSLGTVDLDRSDASACTPSVWDMVDAWETSRKRGEDVLMDDAVDVKRICLGLDALNETAPLYDWESPIMNV